MPGIATASDLEHVISDLVERLSRGIRVEAIVLYGSYAGGTPHDWSDIDIAVISPDFEGARMAPRLKKVAHLMVGADPRLAPIAFPSSEYHDPPRASFLREILRTGKVVYEAPEAQRAE